MDATAFPVLLDLPTLSIRPFRPAGFFPPVSGWLAPDTPAGPVRDATAARLALDLDGAREAAARGGDDPEARLEGAAARLLAGDAPGAGEALRPLAASEDAGLRYRAGVGIAAALGVESDFDGALAALDGLPEPPPGNAVHALALANRSAALLGAGRHDLAERAAADALRVGRRTRDERAAAPGAMASALAHLARGRRGEARARLGEAVRAFARAGDVLRQLQCHHLLGEIAYDGEDPIRAGAHYRDALALARPARATAMVELLTLRFEHR